MGSIVEWQSLKMQEYRYSVLVSITRFFELLGVHRPMRYDPPAPAGDYDHALHTDHPEAPSFLAQYLEKEEEPKLGGKPKETAPGMILQNHPKITCKCKSKTFHCLGGLYLFLMFPAENFVSVLFCIDTIFFGNLEDLA